MTSPLRKVSEEVTSGNEEEPILTKEKIHKTLTEELIIGICAPIGSTREPVIAELKDQLEKEYNYEVRIIKLSDFIAFHQEIDETPIQGQTDHFTKLMAKIKAGDALRKKANEPCLVELAITEIFTDRVGNKNINEVPLNDLIIDLKTRRVCYIIDSLKHIEELKLLRATYRDIFYLFSIFSPFAERRANLLNKNLSKEEIERLINTDEFENSQHGQNVRDTFVEGDFFFRVSEQTFPETGRKVSRYLDIIFESAIVTPSPNEIAMYEAKSAAGNSACLSRQVGAAITNPKGEIISRGWNDVPKFGGNLYKDGEENDNRCFITGYCSNDSSKDVVAEDVLNSIILSDELKALIPDLEKMEKGDALYNAFETSIRRNSKIKDLIEFSRSVHAEMHAIIIGSQLAGNKMVNGKLFCTTYPCHNCARHIIVAGITEIYYIEPYKKSLGLLLHDDALTEDENVKDKTKILMFDGVAPRRYLEFFTLHSSRKDKFGKVILTNKKTKSPKTRLTLQAIPTLEVQSLRSLLKIGLLNEA